MTQTLYTHMNNKSIKKKKKPLLFSSNTYHSAMETYPSTDTEANLYFSVYCRISVHKVMKEKFLHVLNYKG
jgi:hypothetical protein